jgi:hypothetical protein
MSVKLNRPPKPEESQKNSNFSTAKTIPYLEPKTSGLAVGSLNHCTIGSTSVCSRFLYFQCKINKISLQSNHLSQIRHH